METFDQKKMSRGAGTDMSPGAVSRRIDIVDELYEAWLMLRKAKQIQAEEIRENPRLSAVEKQRD